MDLLFAGLLALGVAVTVVVLLKSLCFMGECLSDRCNQRMTSQLLRDYYQAVAHPGVRHSSDMRELSTSAQVDTGMSSQSVLQNSPERLYVICVETNAPKLVRNPKPLRYDDQDIESPPTYEEAMCLVHPSITPASGSCHPS
ncbi:Uncharacterized protein APZ42_032532 [Daphnia magna]|uniref:Uncharacterized protein n=2 Tax=Daphnia magna TaxID=35525 RepID=A0A0P5U7G9_9CRUS|nr:hypothetical protein OUZ56_031416 [Daphnia magna]KZS04268.1 Uncharacterized protein APZ42_032532 [Daphnia magna]